MIKQTITYPDLDGKPVTEDFWFHLSKAEITELEMSIKGGLAEYLRTLMRTEDNAGIIALFKRILMMSVGRRSDDNRRFMKTPEITQDFMCCDAYSQLFMELITDAGKAATFVNGVVPKELSDAVTKQIVDVQLPENTDIPNFVKDLSNEQLTQILLARKVDDIPFPGLNR